MNWPASSHASTAAGLRHRLSPAALVQASELMTFNWLVASYAHRDWLPGPWADLLEPRGQAGMALLRRASLVLMDRHHLRDRFLARADECPWMLLPADAVRPIADELGLAMLGGWVRGGLEREQVAQQVRVLGAERRQRALQYAARLTSLPDPEHGDRWPIELLGPASVVELGISCMAALLEGDAGTQPGRDSGAQERFAMRFPRGLIVPLRLTLTQREEARNLIAELMQRHTTEALS